MSAVKKAEGGKAGKARGLGENVGYVIVFVAGILWGTIGLFVKAMSGIGVSSTLTAFMRVFAGLLIMIPVLIFQSKKTGRNLFKIDGKGLVQCLLLGTLTQALFNYCYNLCIGNVGMAAASILLYTSPVFVFVMSALMFHEKATVLKLLSIVMNLAGCFLMVSGGDMTKLRLSAIGIFFGLSAAFLYSLVTIIGKVASGSTHTSTIVFYSFLFGAVTLAVFTRPWNSIAGVLSPKFFLYSFCYGLIPTVGAYGLYMKGISKKIELSRTPILASVETVMATLIGYFLFSEPLGAVNVLGLVILLASIAVSCSGARDMEKVV